MGISFSMAVGTAVGPATNRSQSAWWARKVAAGKTTSPPCVAHPTWSQCIEERDWHVIWDVDPVAASLVRNRIADEVADREDLVVGAHFPEMKFGRVVTTGRTRRFIQV
jgi:hypothetical protein